jgi:hypothetical protein
MYDSRKIYKDVVLHYTFNDNLEDLLILNKGNSKKFNASTGKIFNGHGADITFSDLLTTRKTKNVALLGANGEVDIWDNDDDEVGPVLFYPFYASFWIRRTDGRYVSVLLSQVQSGSSKVIYIDTSKLYFDSDPGTGPTQTKTEVNSKLGMSNIWIHVFFYIDKQFQGHFYVDGVPLVNTVDDIHTSPNNMNSPVILGSNGVHQPFYMGDVFIGIIESGEFTSLPTDNEIKAYYTRMSRLYGHVGV